MTRSRVGLGRAARPVLLLGCLAASGCVAASVASDVGRVQELTHVRRLASVVEVDVDPAASEDARQLLREPLDADAAVRVALLNNRELRAALRELGVTRGRVRQAGLLPNPALEVELLPERNTQVELRVEYDVTRAVLAPVRARALEPEIEAARYRAAGAVVELGYRVRTAFYRLQAAEQGLAVAQRVLDGQAAAREAATAMFDAGNITELALASEEVAYQKARITVAQLELGVVTDRERLQRLLGTHGADTEWRLRGQLPSVPEQAPLPEELETRALRASLELAEAQQRLESLARRTGATRAEGWLPDITLDVHALQGNPEDSGASERDFRLGAGVSATLPFFDRAQGTVSALEAEFDALLERYYGMAVDVRSSAREVWSRVHSAHARARQYQNVIVPAQRRVTEQALLQYNAMQLGIFELLESRRQELDVQLAYVETLREYWSAKAELDALLAGKRVLSEQPARNGSGAPEPAPVGEH